MVTKDYDALELSTCMHVYMYIVPCSIALPDIDRLPRTLERKQHLLQLRPPQRMRMLLMPFQGSFSALSSSQLKKKKTKLLNLAQDQSLK